MAKWSKDTIADAIRAASIDGVINSSGMNALNANARRIFGTWEAACDYAGVVTVSKKKRRDAVLLCSVDGCDCLVRSPLAKYCEKHYMRLRRHGNTLGLSPRVFHDNCLYCEVQIKGSMGSYCSRRCKTRATRNAPRFKSCSICGKTFEAFGKHVTCSSACKSIRKPVTFKRWLEQKRVTDPTWFSRRAQSSDRRRRVKNDGEKDINFRAIFGKDEGVCWLCSYPIRLDVKWPHPQSLSFDHVIAIAKGGQHVASNLRIAHLVCNLRKQDKSHNIKRSSESRGDTGV